MVSDGGDLTDSLFQIFVLQGTSHVWRYINSFTVGTFVNSGCVFPVNPYGMTCNQGFNSYKYGEITPVTHIFSAIFKGVTKKSIYNDRDFVPNLVGLVSE